MAGRSQWVVKNFGIRFQPVLKTKLKCQIQIQIYENAWMNRDIRHVKVN